jgi:mannitol-specific phosphotransferase system IIBC component
LDQEFQQELNRNPATSRQIMTVTYVVKNYILLFRREKEKEKRKKKKEKRKKKKEKRKKKKEKRKKKKEKRRREYCTCGLTSLGSSMYSLSSQSTGCEKKPSQ